MLEVVENKGRLKEVDEMFKRRNKAEMLSGDEGAMRSAGWGCRFTAYGSMERVLSQQL
jgi:hypothetical protein